MHRTIANKVYDTDTAHALGNWQRGYSSERGFISETLYQKKNGEYFLHGEGGPRSRYAQRVAPNTWGYGERIIPFTNEEAHAWAENHLTESAYDTAFGANANDMNLTLMMVRLKSVYADKLSQLAQEQGRQPVDLAEEIIARALEADLPVLSQ